MPDTDYDDEVDDRYSSPKHWTDLQAPCSWCKAAWVIGSDNIADLVHLPDCAFADQGGNHDA